MNAPRLTEREVAQLASDLFAGERARTERQAQPVAIVMAGQSGAGKSTVASDVRDELARRGGSVLIDADAIRPSLPYFGDLDPGKTNIAEATQADAGRVAQALEKEATAAGRNVVIVGTLRDSTRALESTQRLHAAGYRVELHAVAVHQLISQLRATQREEAEAAQGMHARHVPAQWQAESYTGAASSVRRLEHAGAVERLVVYNRLGDPIVDAVPQAGTVQAADAFDRARSQLTNYERIALARDWDEVVESMAIRGAPRDAQALASERAERAHYTLRASPQAAAAYDDAEPANAQASKEQAARYASRLVDAYRANDHALAPRLPELVPAFAASAAAAQLVKTQGQPAAALDAVKERISQGLRKGEALSPPRLREHQPQQTATAER